MLDEDDKLYLLEINYTPSFSTETPLDHLIKSNLIRDTLDLMNVTPAARNYAQKIAKEELDRRVYTGKTLRLTAEERDRQARLHQQ
jgi:tubulin polyglutamylase TTLL6/13